MKFRVGDRVLCNNPTMVMDDLPGTVESVHMGTLKVVYTYTSPVTNFNEGFWSTEYVRLDPKYQTKLHKALQ